MLREENSRMNYSHRGSYTADVQRSKSQQYKMFAEDDVSVQLMGSASPSSLPAVAASLNAKKDERRSSGV